MRLGKRFFLLLSALPAGWLALSTGQLHAQQRTDVFEDAHGINGRITYQGERSDSILPKRGNYHLSWRTGYPDSLRTYRAEGTLNDHLPHGKWVLEEADWTVRIEPGENITPSLKGDGTHRIWEANFNKGKANGTWAYTSGPAPADRRRPSQALRIQVEFNDAVITKRFTITDERTPTRKKIDGAFTKEGIADEVWTFEHRDEVSNTLTRARLTFANGLLMKHDEVHVYGNVTDTLYHYRSSSPDPKYLHEIGEHRFSLEELPGLGGTSGHYFKQHLINKWSLDAFPFEPEFMAPAFKKFSYPFSSEDSVAMTTIREALAQTTQLIASTREANNLEIQRNRTPQLDLAIAFLDAADTRVQLIDSLTMLAGDPLFTYRDWRSPSFLSVLDVLHQAAEYRTEHFDDSLTASLPALPVGAYAQGYFAVLNTMANDLSALTFEQVHFIDEQLVRLQRNDEIRMREAQLIERRNSLDSLYTSTDHLTKAIKEKWVTGFLGAALREYAAVDSYEEALPRADGLLAKIDSLTLWVSRWRHTTAFSSELEKAYSYLAYNPYTGESDIRVSVKNRFRKNAEELTIPWMTAELLSADTWPEFVEVYERVERVKRELVRFAFTDSRSDRRLEARLRKEKNPERFVRAFLAHMRTP